MKYVIIIPDGCADEPQDSLGGKTPLQAAETPAMNNIASKGIVGRANHTPKHLTAGSAVANMSLLGYDPIENFTGRAPLEAAAQGIELGPNDWAIRCNLVTIQDQIMRDFTADHITSEQARELLSTAQNENEFAGFEFAPGVSYRNLLLYRGNPDSTPFSNETRSTPPHDLTDKTVENDFPRGPGSQLLSEMMSQSCQWFADHTINKKRVADGNLPATNLWLWGLGRRPKLASFASIHNLNGAMITAVDLLRGLAAIIGWDRIEVPGATGYIDTDYAAKGQYGIEALAKYDVVCIHIEAPDEASHEGNAKAKVDSLESIDSQIVAPMLEHLKSVDDWRIMVTPDHPTFVRTKTHTHGDVPFTICGSNIEQSESESAYDEIVAAASVHSYPDGSKLMSGFLTRTNFND